MSSTGDKQKAWDAHWRSGSLSSLSSGDKSTEAPEAIAAWNGFFGKLSGGAKILDIATGNGIVPAHARAFSQEFHTTFEITGIDRADIDPLATVTEQRSLLEGITFLAGIAAEDLPFEDALFDAVTGQYAIEYTNTVETAGEVARVLKAGGRFRFVCHAREGGIVTFNAPKAQQCAWLLKQSGVFEALSAAARAAFENSPEREETRTRFRKRAVDARGKLAKMGENQEVQDLLNNLVQVYIARDQFGNYAGFEKWLKGVFEEVAGQLQMIRALEEAALDFDGIDRLSEVLQKAGFDEIAIAELHAGPNKTLLAWQIEGVRV